MIDDLRYAIRALRRSRSFFATAVATLAVGVAFTVAMFSVVDATVLKPLPFPGEDRLVRIWETNPHNGLDRSAVSAPNAADWRARAKTLSELAAYYVRAMTVTGGDEPERVQTAQISPVLFTMLGVSPVLGRAFSPEQPGSAVSREAVISYEMWRSRFAGSPDVLTRTIHFEGRPDGIPIVGVMPPGFAFPERAQLWMPEALPVTAGESRRGVRFRHVIAQISPGVSLDAVRSELELLQAQLATEHPKVNAGWGARVETLREGLSFRYRQTLFVLLSGVLCLVVLGAANVANLLFARTLSRQHEFAICLALGASRARMWRQMFAETMVTVVVATIVGTVVARWMLSGAAALLPPDVSRLHELAIDSRVLLFAVGVAALTALIVASAPAVYAGRMNLRDALARRGDGPRVARVRSLLVVAEVTLTILLLVGAAVFFRSFLELKGQDPGFTTAGIVTAELRYPIFRFAPQTRRPWHELGQAFTAITDSVRAQPGISGVAGGTRRPFHDEPLDDVVWRSADPDWTFQRSSSADERIAVSHVIVTPEYFDVLRIPLRRGRSFTYADRVPREALNDPRLVVPRVAIINNALAERLWPGTNPIGRRLVAEAYQQVLEVVGVVGDVRDTNVASSPEPQLYEPVLQNPPLGLNLFVRAGDAVGTAAAIRQAARRYDAQLLIGEIVPLDTLAARHLGSARVTASLLTIFALFALVVSAFGIYAVLSFVVTRQRRDLAVRAALGASASRLRRHVLRVLLVPVVVGAGAAMAIVFAFGRVVGNLLFGVRPLDPVALAAGLLVFITVAGAGCVLPSRRAARVDPLLITRAE